jgi:hypothetical protein
MPDIQTAFKTALSKTLQEWDSDGEAFPVPSSARPVSSSQPTQGIPMTAPAHRFPVKNNISRSTFNYIRDNPGSTRKEIIISLEHAGYNEASISSLISQMRKNSLIHTTNDLYYADVPEYVPVKNNKAMKSKGLRPAREPVQPKVKRKYEKKAVTGIGALLQAKLASTPTPVASEPSSPQQRKAFVSLVRTRSPEDILKDMTVYQARELYVHLKQMFGG